MLQWQSPPSDPRLSSILRMFHHSLEIVNTNQPRINRFHNSHGRKQEKDHASNISQSFPEAEIVNLVIAIVSSMFLENQVSFCTWFWKKVSKPTNYQNKMDVFVAYATLPTISCPWSLEESCKRVSLKVTLLG